LPLILPSRPNASRRLLDAWIGQRDLSLNVTMEVDDPDPHPRAPQSRLGFSLLSEGGFASEARLGELAALPFRPRAHWELALVTPATLARPDILQLSPPSSAPSPATSQAPAPGPAKASPG